MARNESLTFIIRAKNMFANTFTAAKKGLSSLASSAASAAKRFGVAFAAMAASSLVLGRSLVNTWKQQATAEARLEAVLKATGYAAGFTAAELKKQASAIQRVTSVGDEAIIPAQALLATFREIKGDQFKEATVAILDMATVMASTTDGTINLQSATMAVGKALNDPIRGITALRRVGVSFTKQQEDQIRNFVAAGQVAKAQAIILAELKSEFGGAAEGGNKMVKAIDLAKATFGDLQESIGGAIANSATFRDALAKIQGAMDRIAESGVLEEWADRAMDKIGLLTFSLEKARSAVSMLVGPVSRGLAILGRTAEGVVSGGGFGASFSAAMEAERIDPAEEARRARHNAEVRANRKRETAEMEQHQKAALRLKQVRMQAALAADPEMSGESATKLAKERRVIMSAFAEPAANMGEGEIRQAVAGIISAYDAAQAAAVASIDAQQGHMDRATTAAQQFQSALAALVTVETEFANATKAEQSGRLSAFSRAEVQGRLVAQREATEAAYNQMDTAQKMATAEEERRKDLVAELKPLEEQRWEAEAILKAIEDMQKQRAVRIKVDADMSALDAGIASLERQIRNVLVLDTANPREERQQLQERQAEAKRIAKETADDAEKYARLAERRSQGRPLTRRSREWAEAYEEAGSSLKVATDLQAQKASLELRRGEVQEKMAETLEKIREDLSKLLRAS